MYVLFTNVLYTSTKSDAKKLLRKEYCPVGNINQTIIPQTEVVKYLELHFDAG